MVDLKTPQEDFTTARVDTAAIQAATPFTNSYGTLSVSGGVMNVQCNVSYGHGAQTAENYTWDGTGIYCKPVGAPKGGAATAMETFLAISDGASTDDSVRMAFNINTAPATPTIKPILYNVDNTYSDVSGIASATYVVGTTHAWLGFSYDATRVRWWRSPDGTTWTEIGNAAKPAWVANATLTFIYSTNRVAGSNTNATLDNFNINGSIPGVVATQAVPLGRSRPARIWSVNS